jgi:transcriptional regulator with XRE-family HTH domain
MSDQRHYIKEWRLHRGLTQEQMAERVGIDKSYLSKIENGKKRYDQPFLEAASEVLACTPADLIARNPADPDGIWALYDKMTAPQRAQATEVFKALMKVS